MFGLFKKKAPSGSFIIVAIQTAVTLRKAEQKNGGQYTPPELIIPTAKSIARNMNYDLSGDLIKITESCVMEFLMDQKFVDDLIRRSQFGPIGALTANDEKEIDRITKHLFGNHL